MNSFFVSKRGDDKNIGTADYPFLTIERAQRAVRQNIAAGLCAPVTVTVEEGEYCCSGIVFDAADSGTKEYPVTWQDLSNNRLAQIIPAYCSRSGYGVSVL